MNEFRAEENERILDYIKQLIDEQEEWGKTDTELLNEIRDELKDWE